MEKLVTSYKNKNIFITGHTGFKGSWLSSILTLLGANVFGYSKSYVCKNSHYHNLKLGLDETFADIRDFDNLNKSLLNFKPDLIFHLAAQPLVRASYDNPLDTFTTNILGTANLLYASISLPSLRGIINVTTDKVYANDSADIIFCEDSPLGGHDPYSSSKACAEIIGQSFQKSFFQNRLHPEFKNILLSNVRAGNVIGGGDWAEDRLIPDIFRALKNKKVFQVRNPNHTRPWQHVLEPLYGYLLVGQHLLLGNSDFAIPFNFGPRPTDTSTVLDVVQKFENLSELKYEIFSQDTFKSESHLIKLDSSRARDKLNWNPILSLDETLYWVANWYKEFEQGNIITELQIKDYLKKLQA